MYPDSRLPTRRLAALAALIALAALAGCQNHKTIVRVNGVAITDEEYDPAVSRVTDADLQGLAKTGVQTDAGGAGLIGLVKEKLLLSLAKDKNITIPDATVNGYIQYLTRTNPNLSNTLESGTVSKTDLPRLIRESLLISALGSNNANVPEEDVKKEFDANKAQYNYPEIFGFKAVPVPNPTDAIQMINQIKATGDFASAATKISPSAGITRYFVAEQLPPALTTALEGLKEGQIAPAPIELPGQGGGPPANLVVQLVRRMPKGDATLAEAHEAARQRALLKTQPQMQAHSQEVLNEYNQKANVEVYLDRYKSVVKAALTPPPAPPMSAGGAPGAGGPGGQPMPAPPRMAPSAPPAPASSTKTGASAPASKP